MDIYTYIRLAAKTDINYFVSSPECRISHDPKILQLVHAALGMSGEFGELDHAISVDNYVNIFEELGDILWYHSRAVEVADMSSMIQYPLDEDVAFASYREINLILFYHISTFCDRVKRTFLFNKPPDILRVQESLCYIEQLVAIMCSRINTSISACRAANIAKLQKRYPTGKFTVEDESQIKRDLTTEECVLRKIYFT